MSYGYVCTNYNNAHFTRIAVESLHSSGVPPQQIVVVDNRSKAEDVAALRSLAERFSTVDLVLNGENIGYFPGLNAGLQRIRSLDPDLDCIVIGNNDLEFPSDFGEVIEAVMPELADRPVISPNIVTLDGMRQNPHVVSGISRPREFVYDLYYSNYHLARLIRNIARYTSRFSDRQDERGHRSAGYIYQGHGSCYILTKQFFELFDELWAPTFLMGEEYFLSKQLSDRGNQVYYEPRILVRHRCNGAIENVPSRKMWELARDAHRVYRRYVNPWRKQGA